MTASTKLWRPSSVRLRIALLILAALSIEGLMRSNLNMAMVCMLNSTLLATEKSQRSAFSNASANIEHCPVMEIGKPRQIKHRGTFTWSSQERAVLFAMFYVGGLLATLTTEKLIRTHGPKIVVLWGALVNVIGTFVTPPTAAFWGAAPLFFVRFVMGFGQGVLYPCMSVLVAKWFPAIEKSTAIAITTTGNQVSVVIALFLTAELCQLPWWDGWPFAFHLYGIVGVLFCVFWIWGVSDDPSDSRVITDAERTHINEGKKEGVRTEKPEWRILLRSPLVWSLAACSFCHNFITVGTVTYLPFYYRTVLNMSLTSNGVFSALPFVGQFVSKIMFAKFAEDAKRKKWMTSNNVIKLCNSLASFGIAFCFLTMCFLDCTKRNWAIAAVFGAMAFVSGYVPGYNTSVVCVAPAQTGAIASLTRFWAQIGSSIAPYMIGALAKKGTLSEWRVVFISIVVLCVTSGLSFQLFAAPKIRELEELRASQAKRALVAEKSADLEEIDPTQTPPPPRLQ